MLSWRYASSSGSVANSPKHSLADVCFKAGYIDSWGRGTIKIIEACKDAGLPGPVLKEEQGGFLSKIFKDRFTEDQLKKSGLKVRQIEAILYTKKYREITNSEYQEVADVSKATTTPHISKNDNTYQKLIYQVIAGLNRSCPGSTFSHLPNLRCQIGTSNQGYPSSSGLVTNSPGFFLALQ